MDAARFLVFYLSSDQPEHLRSVQSTRGAFSLATYSSNRQFTKLCRHMAVSHASMCAFLYCLPTAKVTGASSVFVLWQCFFLILTGCLYSEGTEITVRLHLKAERKSKFSLLCPYCLPGHILPSLIVVDGRIRSVYRAHPGDFSTTWANEEMQVTTTVCLSSRAAICSVR